MRLIDADVTEKIMSERYRELAKEYGHYDHYTTGYGDALSVIEDSPTIEAEPVVRCKECKYWGDEDGKLQGSDGALFARCKIHNYLLDGRHTGWCPTENDFCSYGERKEGATDGC